MISKIRCSSVVRPAENTCFRWVFPWARKIEFGGLSSVRSVVTKKLFKTDVYRVFRGFRGSLSAPQREAYFRGASPPYKVESPRKGRFSGALRPESCNQNRLLRQRHKVTLISSREDVDHTWTEDEGHFCPFVHGSYLATLTQPR